MAAKSLDKKARPIFAAQLVFKLNRKQLARGLDEDLLWFASGIANLLFQTLRRSEIEYQLQLLSS